MFVEGRHYEVNAETGCWEWLRSLTTHGYGGLGPQYKGSHGTRLAHRAMYVNRNGPLESSEHLDHLCSNRACVNPDHLEPVAHAENCRRGAKSLYRDRVEEIRQRRSAGEPARSIAEDVGCSRSTVYNIANGRRWVTETPE